MRQIISALIVFVGFIPILEANHKNYVDSESIQFYSNNLMVHIGDNNWVDIQQLNRDTDGIFYYESALNHGNQKLSEYERKWKCPYCYNYWPIGKPCDNKDCPSRYK